MAFTPNTVSQSTYSTTINAEPSLVSFIPCTEASGTTVTDVKRSITSTVTAGTPVAGAGGFLTGGHSIYMPPTTTTWTMNNAFYGTTNTNFSVEFWFNTTDLYSTQSLWYNAYSVMNGDISGVLNDWGVGIQSYGDPIFGVGNSDMSIATTGILNNGNWHHFVATRNGTTGQIILYVDGNQVYSRDYAPTGSKPGNITWSCGGASTNGYYFSNFALYNSVLPQANVQLHYTTAGGTVNANSIIYYTLIGDANNVAPSQNVATCNIPSPNYILGTTHRALYDINTFINDGHYRYIVLGQPRQTNITNSGRFTTYPFTP
jgi:Concanavalin A-like lectin/glucanases superfamily